MIAHIILAEKFTNSYIKFINENFDSSKHVFLVIGSYKGIRIEKYRNSINLDSSFKSICILSKTINKANKIILHGIFNNKILIALTLQPWILKKSYWVIWGGDLYCYNARNKSLKCKINEFFRRRVIKNLGGVITHIKGDYELVKNWYGFKGKYYYSFMYISNVYKEYVINSEFKEEKESKVIVQIGNSADPSNSHLEVLEKLKEYKGKIEIICPLSYGDMNYKNLVISKGKEIFKEDFKPIIKFLQFDEYLQILNTVDVAIFNHKRQQAVGNITTLLGMGKKVYIRDDITTWKFCEEHNLKVYKVNDIEINILENMDYTDILSNISNIKEQFSLEKLIMTQKNIFDDINI
ncbi:TDP-N-acetylfucosamine:lipid II N-acetylfucosaminyltransferase [Clostridium perfringens]